MVIKLFKNKKGATHVDWIMSLGIFLVSIGLLFTFLKPGSLPDTARTDLIDNLIEKFNQEFVWEVRAIPLFIKHCKSAESQGGEPLAPPGGPGGGDGPTGSTVFETSQKQGDLQLLAKSSQDEKNIITGRSTSVDTAGQLIDTIDTPPLSRMDEQIYILCTDTDDGNKKYIPGRTSRSGMTFVGRHFYDSCDDDILTEYFCDESYVDSTTHDCGPGACGSPGFGEPRAEACILEEGNCADGVDNDNDNYIDDDDPDCATGIYENTFDEGATECSDGLDNDDDGATDDEDFSCFDGVGVYVPSDNDEVNPLAQCQDGLDNDSPPDDLVDYPEDPGCTSPQDNYEGGTILETETKITIGVQNDWKFSRVKYKDDTWKWNLPLQSANQIEFYCRTGSGANDEEDVLFDIEETDKAEFLLSYHKEDISSILEPQIQVTKGVTDPAGELIEDADIRLGSEEILKGVELEHIEEFTITNDDYNPETLKEEWGFPEGSEFWIQGWKEKDEVYWCGTLEKGRCDYIVNYKTANPPSNANIIQKEVKMVVLSPTGRREPARLFFRTWT